MDDHNIALNANIIFHNTLFRFVNNDWLLNEFLWRADARVNRLANDISNELLKHGYNSIVVTTNVNNNGVYIHLGDGTYYWHISFHLEKLNKPPPGAFHIKNNISKQYQILYVTEYPSTCNPLWTNRVEVKRSTFLDKSTTSICGIYESTINVVLSVINSYFSQPSNPLSLHNNLSGRYNRHPHLMTIIRSRPTEIKRTRLTQGVKGRVFNQTLKKKH